MAIDLIERNDVDQEPWSFSLVMFTPSMSLDPACQGVNITWSFSLVMLAVLSSLGLSSLDMLTWPILT